MRNRDQACLIAPRVPCSTLQYRIDHNTAPCLPCQWLAIQWLRPRSVPCGRAQAPRRRRAAGLPAALYCAESPWRYVESRRLLEYARARAAIVTAAYQSAWALRLACAASCARMRTREEPLASDAPARRCALYSARCVLHDACCMLYAAWCMLHDACCTLHADCCMLHPVCCMRSRPHPMQPAQCTRHIGERR
jgi:hypothetical protein